jgi:hypothetical protein
MSAKETIRAAIQILTQQLIHVTFDGSGGIKTAERFLTNFETILESIKSLTGSAFPLAVKKTMLQTQLRGDPAIMCWENPEFRDLPYEDFKLALKEKFGKDKEGKDKDGKVKV